MKTFTKEDWLQFHDCILEATCYIERHDCTDAEMKLIYDKIPYDLKNIAMVHGMSDSVFRDGVVSWWINNNQQIRTYQKIHILDSLIPKEIEKQKTGILSNLIKPNSSIGYFAAIVAVSTAGDKYLLASNHDLLENELFDGPNLYDNIEKRDLDEKLTNFGIYKCQIKVHSYRCNRPDDPEEWDMQINIEDVEEIIF